MVDVVQAEAFRGASEVEPIAAAIEARRIELGKESRFERRLPPQDLSDMSSETTSLAQQIIEKIFGEQYRPGPPNLLPTGTQHNALLSEDARRIKTETVGSKNHLSARMARRQCTSPTARTDRGRLSRRLPR